MNHTLQKLMSRWYRITVQHLDPDRCASSRKETSQLRDDMVALFEQYNIKSVFDAGCNDTAWARELNTYVKYSGGDISPGPVAEAWNWRSDLDISIHDCTTDPFPSVDCILSRDVVIHLNQADRQRFINNWLSSRVPWLLVTQQREVIKNQDFEYSEDRLGESQINWQLPPWSWPEPREIIQEVVDTIPGKAIGRCLALWHRDDIA